MADGYFSEQARHALRTARALAHERHHTRWAPASVRRHRGPVRPRARRQAAARLRPRRGARHPTEPRPNPALRFTLAQAFRIAAETHTPYVGTEHLVVAMLWEDYGDGLRRQASATPRPPTVRR